MLEKNDKAKFAKVLEVNGLCRDGSFTLDNDGNPLKVPLAVINAIEEASIQDIDD